MLSDITLSVDIVSSYTQQAYYSTMNICVAYYSSNQLVERPDHFLYPGNL